jgi:hypothetical protein
LDAFSDVVVAANFTLKFGVFESKGKEQSGSN